MYDNNGGAKALPYNAAAGFGVGQGLAPAVGRTQNQCTKQYNGVGTGVPDGPSVDSAIGAGTDSRKGAGRNTFCLFKADGQGGYVELATGSYERVLSEYERAYRKTVGEIYVCAKAYGVDKGRDIWDLQPDEIGRYAFGDHDTLEGIEFQRYPSGDLEYLRTGDREVSVNHSATDTSTSSQRSAPTPTVNSGIDPQRLSDAVNGKTRGKVIDARRSATPQTETSLMNSGTDLQWITDAVNGKTRGKVIDVRRSATPQTETSLMNSGTDLQWITHAVNGKTRGIIDARRSATAASQAQTASADSVAELLARSCAGLRGERYVPSDATSAIVDGENSGHGVTSLELTRKIRSHRNVAPMPKKQLHRIMKAFKRQGGIIQIDDATDDYLTKKRVEGITFNSSIILLKKHCGRASVFEELIHATQYKKGKCDGTRMSIVLCEIEAQEKLLRWKDVYGLTKAEIELTKHNLKRYQLELQSLMEE